MVPRLANGATTLITPMPALPMASTVLAGSTVASLSASAPGITGAGTAVAATAADMDTAHALDMLADVRGLQPVAEQPMQVRAEAMRAQRVVLAVAADEASRLQAAVDMQAADSAGAVVVTLAVAAATAAADTDNSFTPTTSPSASADGLFLSLPMNEILLPFHGTPSGLALARLVHCRHNLPS